MTAPGAEITALDIEESIALGPVKILLDDRRLPAFDEFASMVLDAHGGGRPVAVHCVTRMQAVLTSAVLVEVGTVAGDRMEHGSVIPGEIARELHTLGVTVITNPGLVRERGDAYLRDLGADDLGELYRSASLRSAGVGLAAGTDAPFGPSDPWEVARTAVTRQTAACVPLGASERLTPWEALALFFGFSDAPATLRMVRPGQPGDLCLLRVPLREALRHLDAGAVAATVVRGQMVADHR